MRRLETLFSRCCLVHAAIQMTVQALLIWESSNIGYYQLSRLVGCNFRDEPVIGFIAYFAFATLHVIYLVVAQMRANGRLRAESELLSNNPVEFWLHEASTAREIVRELRISFDNFKTTGFNYINKQLAYHPGMLQEQLWKWYEVQNNLGTYVLCKTDCALRHSERLFSGAEVVPFGFGQHQDPNYTSKMRKLVVPITSYYLMQFILLLYILYNLNFIIIKSRATNPLLDEQLKATTLLDLVALLVQYMSLVLGCFRLIPILYAQCINILDFSYCIDEMGANLKELRNQLARAQRDDQFQFKLDQMAVESFLKLRILILRARTEFKRYQEDILNLYAKALSASLVLIIYSLSMAQTVETEFLFMVLISTLVACISQLSLYSLSTHKFLRMVERCHELLARSFPHPELGGLSRTMSPFMFVLYNKCVAQEDLIPSAISIRLFGWMRINFGATARFILFVYFVVIIANLYRYKVFGLFSLVSVVKLYYMLWQRQFQRQTETHRIHRRDNNMRPVVDNISFVWLIPIAVPILSAYIVNYLAP